MSTSREKMEQARAMLRTVNHDMALARYVRSALLLLIAPVVVVELAARLLLASVMPTPPLVAPLAYAHSTYYSPAFEAEVHAASQTTDYRGTWINITHDERRTTDQPLRASHTLWMFGSSTLLSIAVPDAMTIPSYLQRLIGFRYIVRNMALNSANIYTELDRLQNTPVRPGDVVVFYDGAVDAYTPLMRDLKQYHDTALCWRLETFNWSALYHLACNTDLYYDPSFNAESVDIKAVVEDYERGIDKARAWTVSRGATFYHFLQPTVWSKPLSSYEQVVLVTQHYGQIQQIVARVYPTMEAAERGTIFLHVLDKLRAGGTEVYLDGFHVTERANEVIARAIAGALWRVF